MAPERIWNTYCFGIKISLKAYFIIPYETTLTRQRIIFKILLYTFKALHGAAPTYLIGLISPYVPRQALRSADQLLLEQPTHKLKLTGLRAFSVCAPYLWNSVPFEIKSSASVSIFKAKLKTYLFRQVYFETLNF